MEEIDIWRTAQLLIEQHGVQAIVEAAVRQVEMKTAGDDEAAAVWGQILLAIDKLQRESVAAGGRFQ